MMSQKYAQSVSTSETRFTKAPMGELEFSTLLSNPTHLTSFTAGDIVPIYCNEVLPHDTFEMDLDFVIRQATVACPTMGQLTADFYAFFVPNRVVNKSWVNVMGENSSGSWVQPKEITLAPLVTPANKNDVFNIPIGSVADYYGFPTQAPIRKELLCLCNDLKFRGYLEIYNNFFRDQNYQPPVPYSKLNIYNGFCSTIGSTLTLNGNGTDYTFNTKGAIPDGSFGVGSLVKEVYGEGAAPGGTDNWSSSIRNRQSAWNIFQKPFKANKLHDYFTSVLPTPQRGEKVYASINITGTSPLNTGSLYTFKSNKSLELQSGQDYKNTAPYGYLAFMRQSGNPKGMTLVADANYAINSTNVELLSGVSGSNLYADVDLNSSLALDDIRMSAAIQQYYEILGRGGGRYREFINSFFGLEIDNPFDDIPTCLGHFRRELDLFQTAQTSASPASSSGAGTAQGNLAAFGYTNNGGNLFHYTFKEHGYVHVFAVVRHRNVYSSFLSRDNFRMSALDFYSYPLANITEQPVYTREINPFLPVDKLDDVFGYNEAWAEYRMEPDRVSGQMRPQLSGRESESLAYWNYADDVDISLEICDGDWLVSNSEEVVRRSTAPQDSDLPQFKGQFIFHIKKERPMPTYSVAGIDIL